MNILQISTLDSVGGAAQVAHRLYLECKKRKHKSYMLVGKKLSREKDIIEIKSKKENRLRRFVINRLGIGDLFLHNHNAIINSDVVKNADVVNLHNLHGNYFNLNELTSICEKKPVVWTLHDMWAFTGHCAHSFDCEKWMTGCGKCPYLDTPPKMLIDLSALLWQKKKAVYSKSDFTIVVPSKWLMEKVKKSVLKEKRIELIYNGVNEKIFKPGNKGALRKELSLPLDKKIILSFGAGGVNNPWKGCAYLKQAREENGRKSDDVFVEIGSNYNFQNQKNNLIHVPFIKSEKLLAKYYAAADVFLYPSLADTCPLAVLEAMACGLPVITFKTGGIPELVQHMKTGYVARYKDIKDLIRGTKLFLSNEKLLNENSQNSRKRIEKFFTLNIQTEKYLAVYQNI